MSCCSRNPARLRNESSLLQQKPDPQFCFFDRTLVICHRPSDPVTICEKVLALVFSLPQPLTIPKPPVRPVLQQKPDPRIFFFEKPPVIYGHPSHPATICDKLLALAFSSSAAPHPPQIAPSARAFQQNPGPQFCSRLIFLRSVTAVRPLQPAPSTLRKIHTRALPRQPLM